MENETAQQMALRLYETMSVDNACDLCDLMSSKYKEAAEILRKMVDSQT